MSEATKYSPGALVAGFAAISAATLGSFMLESEAGHNQVKEITQCSAIKDDGLRSECTDIARNANNVSGSTDTIQVLGTWGMLAVGISLGVATIEGLYTSGFMREHGNKHTPEHPAEEPQG